MTPAEARAGAMHAARDAGRFRDRRTAGPAAFLVAGLASHLLAFTGAAPAGLLSPLPDAARFLFTWCWLVLAPGWLVARAAGWRAGGGAHRHLAVASATGLGLVSLLAWLAGLARVPFGWAGAGAALAGCAALVTARTRSPREHPGEAPVPLDEPRRGARLAIAGAILLALTSILLFRAGATLGYPEDALAHVAAIRAAMSEARALPGTVWYPAGTVPGPDPRFGIYHGVLALVARESGLAAVDAWRFAPGVLGPAAMAAFMMLAGALWRSAAGPLVAGMVLLLGYEGEDARGLRLVGDPMGPAILVAWVSLALFLEGVRRGERRLRDAGAVVGGAAAFMHVWGAIESGIAFSLFAAAALIARRIDWAMQGLRAAAFTALTALPYLAHRYLSSFHPANPYNWTPQGVLRLGDGWFVLSPQDALRGFGIAGLLSFLLLPWIARRARRDPGLLALASGMGFAALVLPNPLAMPLLYRVLSYLTLRVRYLALHPAALAWALDTGLALALDRREAGRSRARGAAVAGIVVALLVPWGGWGGTWMGASARDPDDGNPLRWRAGLERLDRALPRPAVIATDAYSAYAIPAFTRHHVVAIPWEHASPNDPRPGDRLAAQEAILSPYTGLEETLDLIRREGVSFILLNRTHPRRHEGYGFSILPEALPLMKAKFDAWPAIFEPRLDTAEFILYEVCDTGPDAAARAAGAPALRPPQRVFADAPGTGAAAPAAARFEGGMELVSIRVTPDRAAPGDSVTVECWWRRSAPPGDVSLGRARFPRAYLRLDPAGEELAGGMSKITRKLREEREGRVRRFRARHTPGAGLQSLERLRPGERLHDVWGVRIPRRLAPGNYDVRMALLPMELVPTFEWRDYVSDADRFSGARVASIEVTP